GPRENERRALGIAVDVEEDRADPLPLAVSLGSGLLVARHDRLGPPEVHDHVAPLEALDRSAHQLADLGEELVVDVVAFRLADLLVEDLLGRLRGDPPQADRLPVLDDLVAELDVPSLRLALPIAGRS